MHSITKSIQEFTSLGRALDPSYPSNRTILIAVPIVGILAGVIRFIYTNDASQALITALIVAVSTFLSWAFAREIAPDYEGAAFLAAVFAPLTFLFLSVDSLAFVSLAALLLMTRAVNRTVGPPAMITDSFAILVLAGIAVFVDGWIFGVAAILSLLLDASLQPQLPRHYLVAAVMIAVTFSVIGITGPGEAGTLTLVGILIILVISILMLIYTLMRRPIRSQTDISGYILTRTRVRAAAWVLLVAAVLSGVWHGDDGVVAFVPVWAALAGTSVYAIIRVLMNKSSE